MNGKKIRGFLRNIDHFGKPIQLTFKNQENFRTAFGGTLTIFCAGIILAYLIVRVNVLLAREGTINRQLISTERLTSPLNLTLNATNFQIAASISSESDPDVDMHRYFRVLYGSEGSRWQMGELVKFSNLNEGVPCHPEYLNVKESEWSAYGLDEAVCPDLTQSIHVAG